jgi:hypothetical protein
MRIEQAAAACATEAGPGYQRVRVTEDMSLDVLLLASPPTLLAPELPVEGLECLQRRCQLVRVPFDGLAGELWVHRYELHQASLGLTA